jgi:hypothetical protein
MLADWEAIADSGALDDTLVRSLEQEARVPSCSSSEKSSSTSSGPKRRGRGSFLYDKSVLYSDQCGSQRDSDDKESGPQSGSKDHVNEQENSAVTGISVCAVSLLMPRDEGLIIWHCFFFCSCCTAWNQACPCPI